jgi:hypothetical protein
MPNRSHRDTSPAARLGGVTLGGSLFGGSLIFPYIYHTNNELLYKSIPNTMNTSLP